MATQAQYDIWKEWELKSRLAAMNTQLYQAQSQGSFAMMIAGYSVNSGGETSITYRIIKLLPNSSFHISNTGRLTTYTQSGDTEYRHTIIVKYNYNAEIEPYVFSETESTIAVTAGNKNVVVDVVESTFTPTGDVTFNSIPANFVPPLDYPDTFVSGNYPVYTDPSLTTEIEDIYDSTPFEPDPGEEPDSGGGDQDWGQGSPTTNTDGGTYDNSTDTAVVGDPNSSIIGQFMNNYYVLNTAQVAEVKNKIWGLTVPGFTKPSDGILTLLSFPFDLTTRSAVGDTSISVGNTGFDLTTNAYVLTANANNEVDMGILNIDPYFGGFQDFAPYTKVEIFIPYIGYQQLDPQYVFGHDLGLKYNINFTNGQFVANVYSDGYLFNRFNGQMGVTVPLTQVDNQLIEATLGSAVGLGAALATGGATLALTASAALSTVTANRPSISGDKGGGGEHELSLILDAFLRITRPKCAVAQTYNSEVGRPSLLNKQLSNCKGFTSMVDPKVYASCTAEENDEINELLREGVIINV